ANANNLSLASWFEYLTDGTDATDGLPEAEIQPLFETDDWLELYRSGHREVFLEYPLLKKAAIEDFLAKRRSGCLPKTKATTPVDDGPIGVGDEVDNDPVDKAHYKKRFSAMDIHKKFQLSSGRYVEDVMYRACMKFAYEHFIYNADDTTTTSLFTPEENKEIQDTNTKPNPQTFEPTTGLFARYFSKFRDIMHNFGLNGSIYFRGEKGGLASQVRKDASRKVGGLTAMSRRLTGKKGDGYVRVLGSDARDVAAIEAGPKWEGPGATKALVETEKILPKALLDIFLVMHDRLGNSVDALSKLAVPGLAIYGDRCKRLKLDHVGGYVTRVVSSEWMTLSMSGCVADKMALFVEVFIFRAWVLYNESLTSTVSNAGGDILQLLHKKHVENDVAEIQRQKIVLGPPHPTPKGKGKGPVSKKQKVSSGDAQGGESLDD
ncbi:hypothetical protein HDU77_000896, partial [Chytriomyces hyalinus]